MYRLECLALLFVSSVASAQPKPGRIVVIDNARLLVTWEAAEKASLADDDWLAITIDNRTKRALKVVRANYSVAIHKTDPESGWTISTVPSLASGDSKQLLYAFEADDEGHSLIPPGVHRLSDVLTDSVTASLGEAPLGGMKLELRCTLKLEIEGPKLPNYGDARRNLHVEWQELNRERALGARARLDHILENPEPRPSQSWLLWTLLKTELVSRTHTVDVLLSALDRRTDATEGIYSLYSHLNREFGRDPILREYLMDRLNRGDRDAALALSSMPLAWDPSFIEPLMKIFESEHSQAQSHVWWVFEHAGHPQASDPDLAQRMSKAVLALRPLPEPGEELPAPRILASLIRRLGQTRDANLIPRLVPYLDDERRVFDDTRLLAWMRIDWPPLELRVQDVTLHAILTILDGDHRVAYGEERVKLPQDGPGIDKALCELRDTMIAELKKRLE